MTAEDALKAIEQHEQPQPTTKEQWMEYGMNNPLSTNATNEVLLNNITQTLDAPEPQPTLADIVNTICTQLQLLTTIISQPKAQPEEGTNVPTLQECVSLTLQQADWFKEMVRGIVDDTYDFADYAKDAVEDVVESHVDTYFSNQFDPSDHFDFGDAVQDAVSDQIDDVVSDKIDDAVDAYLSNATISISK
jgi:hypothetical protein